MEKALPSPSVFKKSSPLGEDEAVVVRHAREEISSLLFEEEPSRTLLLIGPCSIHHSEAFLEYASRLADLQKEVEETFLLAIRAYVEKPRTTLGWRGFLLDPNLDGSYQIEKGIEQTRWLFTQITRLGLPIATEILEPTLYQYYQEYVSWGCIGARTCSSPPHRQLASHLPFSMGFKNGIDGNLTTPLQAVKVAGQSHVIPTVGEKGELCLKKTHGNPHCHVVLRGSIQAPNYFPADLDHYLSTANSMGLSAPLIIDCSHDNSRKLAQFQIPVFKNVLAQMKTRRSLLRGMMLESYLKEGAQAAGKECDPRLSITDPCLGWEQTRSLVLYGAEKMQETLRPVACKPLNM